MASPARGSNNGSLRPPRPDLLILVDVINDFVHPNGAFPRKFGAEDCGPMFALRKRLDKLLQSATLRSFRDIVLVTSAYSEGQFSVEGLCASEWDREVALGLPAPLLSGVLTDGCRSRVHHLTKTSNSVLDVAKAAVNSGAEGPRETKSEESPDELGEVSAMPGTSNTETGSGPEEKSSYAIKSRAKLCALIAHRNVLVAGVTTQMCVRKSTLALLDRCQSVTVARELVAGRASATKQEARALEAMREAGVNVVDTALTLADDERRRRRMVLHYVNGSIPSFRVQILLHHLGLEVEHRRLFVMSNPRPTKTAEFLSDVNSRGEAPVLEVFDENKDDSSDDSSKTGASESGESRSFKLRESLAILEFLDEERLAVEKGNAGLQLTNSDSSTAAADPNRNPLHAYARTRQILHESERMRFLIKVLSKFYKPEFQRLVRTRNQRDPAYVNAVAEVTAGLTAIVSELRIWEEEHLVWLPAAGAAAREPKRNPETNLSISAVSFLGGSSALTIADCAFFPILAFLKQRGFPLQTTIDAPAAAAASTSSSSSTSTFQTHYLNPHFPKLAAYFAKMAQLRAVRRASPFNWNVWVAEEAPGAEVAPGANCWKMATDLIAVGDGAGRGGGNLKQ